MKMLLHNKLHNRRHELFRQLAFGTLSFLLIFKYSEADPQPGRSLELLRYRHKTDSLTDTFNHSEDVENSSADARGMPNKFSMETREGDRRHQEMMETLNNVVRKMNSGGSADIAPSDKEVEDKNLITQVVNLMQISKNNADVITQAFRFVRLDAHLATLLSQLTQLRESQESLQAESIKQQTKFNIVLDEIRTLAASISKESTRLTEVEERLDSEMESLSDRIDTAVEKVIQSSVSTQILLDLSKETIQQTDKSVGISNEVLSELKSVRSELGDVGQASVQTIYNVQKLEESLLMAMEETGNKTIYALRQDQQLQYQLFPLASPMKMDVDEVSSVPLGNSSIGNFMQADGTILPESTSLPAAVSSSATFVPSSTTSILNTASASEVEADKVTTAQNEGKQKAQQNMQDTNVAFRTSGKSTLESFSYVSPCPRMISPDRPQNCEQVQLFGHTSSGVYRIYPFESNLIHNGTEVYCDLLSDGGAWTVIQRRKEPLLKHEDFEKTWQQYEAGFGILHDSHWIGLEVISELTKKGDTQLRIELVDWEGDTRVADYGYIRVANSSELFKLYITDYSGNAGDSLAYHNGMAFTTKDMDNDIEKNVNCAQKYNGAWWYKSCHQANLNGQYIDESDGKHESYANGINWYSWHGYYYSLKRVEMKLRSRNFRPNP